MAEEKKSAVVLQVDLKVVDCTGREASYGSQDLVFPDIGNHSIITTALTGADPFGLRAEVKITRRPDIIYDKELDI